MFRKSPYMNKGAGMLHIIFALLFFIMIATFLYIQLTGEAKGTDVQKYVEDEELHKRKGILPGKRGTIYSSDAVTIAEDIPAYDLYAVLTDEYSKNSKEPRHVVDKKMTASKLAPILEMNEAEILEILKKDAKQVEFRKQGSGLSFAKKNEIEALKLPGIFFREGVKRYYPEGQFASHSIGYTAKVEEEGPLQGQVVGKEGIELQLEEFLRKEDGKVSYKTDGKGVILPSVQKDIIPPKNGDNVHLTIDSRIQHLVEEALTEAEKKYKPKSMTAIVADPKTGRILGMSSRPSFDPNLRNITDYMNYPISSQIEAGSTMKIFPLAAAIDTKKYNGMDTFQSGKYEADGRVIGDHNGGEGWGPITFNEGIQRSSNVAMAYLGEEVVGPDIIKDYYNRFGFFKPTGIELPGEKPGQLLFGSKIQRVTTLFGQGSTVTPIQMVQATTAIANDGKMMKPYIVEKVVDPDTNEIIQDHEPTQVGTPISKEAAKETREILETVVTAKNGTGRQYQMEGYAIAGKTGTAQIVNDKTGLYMDGHGNHLLSFIGMVPTNDPKIIVYVNVVQPKLESDVYESTPVSEIFKHITAGALQYMNVKPVEKKIDKLVDNNSVTVPNLKGKSVEEASQQLNDAGLKPVILGNGEVIDSQSPSVESKLIARNKVLLLTDGEITMPDVKTWSTTDVMKLCQLLGIKLEVEGNGYAIQQSIAEGEIIAQDSVLKVQFAQPKAGG